MPDNLSEKSKDKPNYLTGVIDSLKKDRILQFFVLLPLLIIIFSAASLVLNTKPITKTIFQEKVKETTVLTVSNIYPHDTVTIPEKITFVFSDPVDDHLFFHHFYISPPILGTIRHGSSENIIEFIPNVPFKKGMNVSVKVEAGLVSKNNKTLLADRISSFTTNLKDDEVQFISDKFVGRVFTAYDKKPLKIEVRKSSELSKVDVSLYKSTQANLLNYLVYTSEKDSKGVPRPYSETYIKNDIPHKESDRISKETVTKPYEEKTYNLAPGIYYLEATFQTENVVGSSFIVVNSKGVIVRQDDKKITLSTFDLHDNKTVAHEATIGLYNLSEAPNQLAVHTYHEFEASYPFPIDSRLDAIIGTIDSESIFVPLKLPQSQADVRATNLDKTYKIFFYTDRPIYKPKDTVKFSGIVRVDSDSIYKLAPEGTPVRLKLGYDTNSLDMVVNANAHGAFSGEFTIPEAMSGNQYLAASTNLDKSSYDFNAYTYFDVVSYIKPKFEIKANVAKAEYIRNEKLQFTIEGKYFDGQPLKNQQIEYSIYSQPFYEAEKAVYNKNFNITQQGGMCGGGFGGFGEYFGEPVISNTKVMLDENGKADISYEGYIAKSGSQTLTLVATKTDESKNDIISAASTIVHGAENNIFFIPSAQNYYPGDEMVAPFYAENLKGEKIKNSKFTYKFVTTTYNNSVTKEETILDGETNTDDNGTGIIKFNVPEKLPNSSKYIIVQAKDSHENIAQTTKYITILSEKDTTDPYSSYWSFSQINQTYLKISSSKNNFKVGDTISLSIRSPKDLDAVVSFERGRIYRPQVLHLRKGDNEFNIDVSPDLSPSITVVFSFFADGAYHSEGLSLNVPAMHKLLDVSINSDKTKYTPQETANLNISTKDAEGQPVSAYLTLNIVDKAIFALRKSATPPIHSSMYYFRPRSTNASSSQTQVGYFEYGGRGGGGGGGGGLGNAVDSLYWNADLVTDSNGKLTVSVPLKGYETTWKALVVGSTDTTDVGQAETEFIATSNVLGVGTKRGKVKSK